MCFLYFFWNFLDNLCFFNLRFSYYVFCVYDVAIADIEIYSHQKKENNFAKNMQKIN